MQISKYATFRFYIYWVISTSLQKFDNIINQWATTFENKLLAILQAQ